MVPFKFTRVTTKEAEILNSVMTVCAKRESNSGPRITSVREIYDYLYPGGQRALTTVQTQMDGLVRKGVLKKEKMGGVCFYTPVTSQDEFWRREVELFIQEIFDGSITDFLDYLEKMVKNNKALPEKVERIKALLS